MCNNYGAINQNWICLKTYSRDFYYIEVTGVGAYKIIILRSLGLATPNGLPYSSFVFPDQKIHKQY